jgi:hypothetical protein
LPQSFWFSAQLMRFVPRCGFSIEFYNNWMRLRLNWHTYLVWMLCFGDGRDRVSYSLFSRRCSSDDTTKFIPLWKNLSTTWQIWKKRQNDVACNSYQKHVVQSIFERGIFAHAYLLHQNFVIFFPILVFSENLVNEGRKTGL